MSEEDEEKPDMWNKRSVVEADASTEVSAAETEAEASTAEVEAEVLPLYTIIDEKDDEATG